MLPEIVHVADRNDALGRDRVVIGCDPRRNARLAETGRRVWADAGKRREAGVGRRRRPAVTGDDGLKEIVDLLGARVGQLRIAMEVGGEIVGDLRAKRGDPIE